MTRSDLRRGKQQPEGFDEQRGFDVQQEVSRLAEEGVSARVAGVPTGVLIDDVLDLPDNLPGPVNHEEIKRRFPGRRKRASKGRERRG